MEWLREPIVGDIPRQVFFSFSLLSLCGALWPEEVWRVVFGLMCAVLLTMAVAG